jgi:proteic killer suppression protein
MIRSFKNQNAEDVFKGKKKRGARKTCPQSLWNVAVRKLDQLDSVNSVNDLRIPPGNRLETLSGDRQSQFSIRINDQYRICFEWSDNGAEQVEIVDYHL